MRLAARWLIVYIQEAHASDEWTFGQPKDIPQHKTIEERAVACREMIKELGCRIPSLVDQVAPGCNNPAHGKRCGGKCFERIYGVWPLRFYVFAPDGTILLKGMPSGDSYDFDDINRCIEGLPSPATS